MDNRDIATYESSWSAAPGLTATYSSIRVGVGAHTVYSNNTNLKFAVYGYGHSGDGAESYGYQAGFDGKSVFS